MSFANKADLVTDVQLRCGAEAATREPAEQAGGRAVYAPGAASDQELPVAAQRRQLSAGGRSSLRRNAQGVTPSLGVWLDIYRQIAEEMVPGISSVARRCSSEMNGPLRPLAQLATDKGARAKPV